MLLYDLVRAVINKEFNFENFILIIENLTKVKLIFLTIIPGTKRNH